MKFENSGVSPVKSETGPPYTEGKERLTKEQTTPDWYVAGLITKACLGQLQEMSRSLHPPAGILKVYIYILTGPSHVYSPDDLNNTWSLKAVSLKQVPLWVFPYIARTGEGVGVSDCSGAAWGSTGSHVLLMTSSNRSNPFYFCHQNYN